MNRDTMRIRTMQRLWEVDFLRGIAILMMVMYHLIYDLYYLGGYKIDVYHGVPLLLARTTATLFLLLVGISLVLSISKARRTLTRPDSQFSKYLRRGLRIFSLGLLLTLVTWLAAPQGTIIFGILHCIGVSIILAYPFYPLRAGWHLVIGVGIILLGLYLQRQTFTFPWLVWLGFVPKGFFSFDYFPLLPWFGLVQLGLFLGKILYKDGVRRRSLPDLSGFLPVSALRFLGRHSLVIYVLHQPLLILSLLVLGIVSLNDLLALRNGS